MIDDTLDDTLTPDPTPQPAPAPVLEADDAHGVACAVYDATRLRFVSGVYPTRAKATAARKALKLEDRTLEIRKV